MSTDILSLDSLLKPSIQSETNHGKVQKPPDNAKTLEAFHNKELSKIREEKDNIIEFENLLSEKHTQLMNLEKTFLAPSVVSTSNDIVLLTSRQKLENEIKELEKKIADIKTGKTEADYFLRVGDILFSYTDAHEQIATGTHTIENQFSKKGRMPANSVYSYFSSANESTSEEGKSAPPTVIEQSKIPRKKASDIENDIGFRRDKALESYMSALNPDVLQNDNAIASSITQDYGSCPICETEMFLSETYLDCPSCGYRDFILVDSEKPSYKDPPREMSYYAYKKINHLNEWLAQFQAKETTEISTAVLDNIRAELKKERITDMSKLKASKLKEVIKKLKLNRCYDHVAHILNRLNGISAPVLSREVEEKLRFMFKEIQFSFVKHCPKKRSNFLSYSFVLYKFCELLELDEYLPCFPLLKSREKLHMQDKIWQKICEDMKWEFIRTV